MHKINKIFVSSLSSLTVILSSLPIISCGKKNTSKLDILGGTDRIFIDQTQGDSITGWHKINFNIFYNNTQLPNDSVMWNIVDCDSNKISVYDQYIIWNNPELKNTTFRLKATYFDEQLNKNIEGITNEIQFVADPNTFKIEFTNSDPSAHQIVAERNTAGSQGNPWVLKINGEPYEGLHEHFTLIDINGNQPGDISFNSQNVIEWNDSLRSGQEQYYIKTTIVDQAKKKSYDIVSSNNPINFFINQPKLSIEGNKKSGYVPARKTGVFSNYKLVNQNNVDITTSPTTYWNLQNTGEKDFGNNISINNGEISYSKELNPGLYSFKIKASDGESGYETLSDDINLLCYETLTVKGGQKNINIWQGEKGYDANPWVLLSGETPLVAESFEIVPVNPDEQEIIDKLKEHVKLNATPTNDGMSQAYLTWDSTTPYGKYKFKIQATYNGTNILSDQINFNLYDKSSKFIYFDHNISSITAFKSYSTIRASNSAKSNAIPKSKGKCNKPISVYFCTGQKIKFSDLKITFSGVEGVKFSIDEDGYLSWDGLNEANDTQIQHINVLTIKAEYQYESFRLQASTTIEFDVEKLYDDTTFKTTDISYSFRRNIDNWSLRPIYFPNQKGQQYYLTKDGINAPFKKPILSPDASGLMHFTACSSKSKSHSETRHMDTILFTPIVPARSKLKFTIDTGSPCLLHLYSSAHPIRVSMKGDISIGWWSDPDYLPKCLPVDGGNFIWKSFAQDKFRWKENDPLEWNISCGIELINDSFEARKMPVYLAVTLSLAQGNKVFGPDLGTYFDTWFNIFESSIDDIE